MKTEIVVSGLSLALALAVLVGCGTSNDVQATNKSTEVRTAPDRTMLPIAEPDYPRATELDARNAKAPPRFEVKAPKGAPNVIIFLIDDIGFGHAGTFGGQIPMPT